MADDEIGLTDVDPEMGGDLGDDVKSKGVSNGIAKILIWVVGVLVGIILCVTISVITFKIMNSRNNTNIFPAVSREYETKLEEYAYFSLIETIRTRTSDVAPHSVIVTIQLGYDADDSAVNTELTRKSAPLTDLIRHYFSMKTVAELESSKEPIIKEELKSLINGVLSDGVIKDVIFLELQTIEA